MQRTIRAFLIATTLFSPATSWAQSPDEVGAKKIEEAVKTYGPGVLSKPGAVRVSPDGDGYRLAFDMVKLIADIVAPMTTQEATPRAFKIIEQADGKWSFDSTGPFGLTTQYLAADRSASLALSTETSAIKGVFDPGIVFPRQTDISFANGVATLRDSRDALKIGIKDGKTSSGVVDLPEGRNDVNGTFALQDVSATHGTFPQPEVKVSAEKIDGTYKLGKVDLAGMAALLRFWKVTAPGKEISTLTAAQRDELRALLVKHTPGIDEAGITATGTNLTALEGGKGFRLERLDYETRWEGIGGRAALVMGAKLNNLSVDAGVWPKGLEAILPKEAALNIRASGFDLGALWKDAAQVRTKQETAALPRDHFMAMFLPEGKMTVDFKDSFARSSFYDLTLSGQLFVGRDSRKPPLGTLTVTAKDLDKTIKYLQDNTKSVPIFGQVTFGTMMLKGLGKPGPEGATVWEFKYEEGGKITVNGQPLPMRQ
jgi:hypothetical protein